TFALSLAACTSSNAPTRAQYDDTAQAIASTTATSGGGGDIASMTDSVTIAQGAMPTGFTAMGDGHFQGTRLGVDYSYAVVCKNPRGTITLAGPLTDQAPVQPSWPETSPRPTSTPASRATGPGRSPACNPTPPRSAATAPSRSTPPCARSSALAPPRPTR